jgi:hypothetical protein
VGRTGRTIDGVLEERGAKTRWWLSRPFLIIVVAGCFHLGRGAPVDGVLFLATAAALAIAELRRPAPPLPAPTPPRPAPGRAAPRPREIPAAAVLASVPLGWAVSLWQPGTLPVAVVVAATGPPMLYLALTRDGQSGQGADGSHGERAGAGAWWPWAAVGVAICLWELSSFLQQSDAATANPDHPTLSAILEPIILHNPGRGLMIICWLAAGVVLARLMLRSRACAR